MRVSVVVVMLMLIAVSSGSCGKTRVAEAPARWSKPALPREVAEQLSKRDGSMPERRTRLVKLPDGTMVEEQLR